MKVGQRDELSMATSISVREKIRNYEFFIILAMCVALMELFVRIFAPTLSMNVAHIMKIPDIAQEIASKNKGGIETILFMGNSLTGTAVNLDQLGSGGAPGKLSDIASFKVVPDGTSLWDWYCIVKNNFSDNAYTPRYMVIGLAWGEVPPVPSRLAGYFCGITDLLSLYEHGMNGSSDVLEYLVASISKLYVMRETIRKRTLDIIIPAYREITQEVNTANKKSNSENTQSAIQQHRHNLMDDFMRLLHRNSTKLIFIAMPVIKSYPLDKELVRSIRDGGGTLYDYRHLEGLSDDMFVDPIHLSEQGGHIFTARLSSDLNQILGD